jgi:hypothetical protein
MKETNKDEEESELEVNSKNFQPVLNKVLEGMGRHINEQRK